MPNTYTQIHFQFVFAVKYRMALIHPYGKTSYINTLQESFKTNPIFVLEKAMKLDIINSIEKPFVDADSAKVACSILNTN